MPTIVTRTAASGVFSTSQNITIPAVTTGNTLFFAVYVLSAPTSVQLGGVSVGSAIYTNDDYYFYAISGVTGSPTSVTWTQGAADVPRCLFLDVSGATATLDVSDRENAFSMAPSSTFTTTGANSVAIAAVDIGLSLSLTSVTSDWAQTPSSGADTLHWLDQDDLGAADSKTVSGSISTDRGWVVRVASILAAGGGSTKKLMTLGVG
jgi:hypothetical protein